MRPVLIAMERAARAATNAVTEKMAALDAEGGPQVFGGQAYDLCGNSHVVVSGNSKLVRAIKKAMEDKGQHTYDSGEWFMMQAHPGYWLCIRTGRQDACLNKAAAEAMLRVLTEEGWAPEDAYVGSYID